MVKPSLLGGPAIDTIEAPCVVVENFFVGAAPMRAAFEAHFRDADQHGPRQQVWNYWHIPEMYTYLRTSPAKIMPEQLVAAFLQHLNGWAMYTLGLSTRQNPWLSLYVNGCGQGLHNDALNGQMGFVYSITRWDERNFVGGETIVFHQENYWQSARMKGAGGGTAFYDKVPSKFNQLVVFDDRVIHGVQPVQGTMNPLEGRVVLHGHLSAEMANVSGALSGEAQAALARMKPVLEQFQALGRSHADALHGFVTFRLAIQPDGRVASVRRLCDRLLPLSHDPRPLEPFRQELARVLTQVTFPTADGPSELTWPVVVG